MNISTSIDFSLSVKSMSYMIVVEFFGSGLSISEEEVLLRIEIIRRSENDPVVAESY